MASLGNNAPASDWEELSRVLASADTECPVEFRNAHEAVAYLRNVLGDDYLEAARRINKHPFVRLPIISWPGLRSDFLHWIADVRRAEQCSNLDMVLRDLRLPNKCIHAHATLEIAGRLLFQGFKVSFEPPAPTAFLSRSDALVHLPTTAENFFLEVSCQSLAENQLNAFEAMEACRRPVTMHFEKLKCAFRLFTIPAPDHMADLVERIEGAVQSALENRELVEVIEEGTLVMGICHRATAAELDAWRMTHGLHFEGYEGPRENSNETDRLKKKMRLKQKQLPPGYANVLLIDNDHIFSHQPNLQHWIFTLQEELYRHGNLAFVVLQGSNGSDRPELEERVRHGDHTFQRRVRQGQVRHVLLLSNRYTDVKPSNMLLDRLMRTFLAD